MSFKVSSSIFTVPYVCLYNGAAGMCFYSLWFWSVSTFPLQTTLCPDGPHPLRPQQSAAFPLRFSFHIFLIESIE